MEDADGPLDFESEDPLLGTPPLANNKKRRKIIGLDDLLTDYYQEKSSPNESKKSRAYKCYNSDEEDKARKNKEKLLSKFVDDCERQVHEINNEDEISLWGQRVFGYQKPLPPLNILELRDCKLFQSFTKNELNSLLDINVEKGEAFLEDLLVNGWLSKLVLLCGTVEDSIASWTFNLMLYSSNEEIQVSACDFWCSILSSKAEGDLPSVFLDWFPSYAELKDALEIYGYLSGSSTSPSHSKRDDTDSGTCGPPLNIKSWLRLVSACCRLRGMRPVFSISEVEELFGVVFWLFLDRELQGLSFLLFECMESIISFFTEKDWPVSFKKVAVSIANRIPKDLNCLRIIECISGINTHSKQLRSEVAYQILLCFVDKPITDVSEILKLLMSTNVKDKNCDFFKLYLHLVLVENWLLFDPAPEERSVVVNLWCKYLRNCSSQITSTDWRPYASKVRNRASYLLQNTPPEKGL